MLKAYKYRIYPDNAQIVLLSKTFGCCRYVFNHYLEKRIRTWEEERRKFSYTDCSNDMTALKDELSWLKEVDSIALQQSLRNLDKAYGNFFKGSGYPRYKSKHSHFQSYRTQLVNGNIQIENNRIKLPRLGWTKYKNTRAVEGNICNVTVSRTNTGKYFISVCVEAEIEKLPEVKGSIGVDVGLKSFCTLSTGEVVKNPKHMKKQEDKLKRAQRKLSSRQKGSKNYFKERLKVARIHERIANQRRDHLHNLSTRLIRENQVICLEDLKIKNMVKNHKLAGSIQDSSWGEFFRMIEYKSEWYGRTVNHVDPFYPSSQICSNCGQKNPEVRNLAIREWTCSECGTRHDRDLNASINILNQGRRLNAS